jgi:4-amino-4-deoxy-L-arabinose transferase-like glycosyltransferase
MLKRFKNHIYILWNEKPLRLILIIALLLRLISVLFSRGYEMHDDHFLIIEAPQSWLDGRDYNNWLPWNQEKPEPTGHSFFYTGFHFLFFYALKLIGITDPQFKMFLVRLIHALFSMLVVSLGYRITEKLSDRNTARFAGLLLAVYWFMPFFSVRNLVEMVCIPFLLTGLWMVLNSNTRKYRFAWILLAGFVAGMAFSVRYQTSVFLAGIALVLLLMKEIKPAIAFSLGVALSILIFQGIPDFLIWRYPFAEFISYLEYNVTHKYDYITGDWYNYLVVLAGMLIPPFSLLLLWGFLRTWKKHLLFFLPVFLFLIFHSVFPNKQERFIFPIIPFIIILGSIGWIEFYNKSGFWQKNKILYKIIIILFWILNIPGLILYTPSYAKKARVESMTYLSSYKNISFILIEDSNRQNVTMLPRYYLNQWISFYGYAKPVKDHADCSNISVKGKQFIRLYSLDCLQQISNDSLPEFVIFIDKLNIESRVERISRYLPDLEYLMEIEPGFRDKLMRAVNPVNYNVPVYIYKTALLK